jgi:lipopolysaccharide heptosyltransferase I
VKLLFIRLGSLGDIIHTVPAVSAVKRHDPAAEIHWFVDPRHLELLDLVEGVSRVIAVKPSAAGWLTASSAARNEGYDAAIDFQGLLKSAALARLSGARRIIGFHGAALRESAASILYKESAPVPGVAHVIRKNLALLDAIGISAKGIEFRFAARPSAAAQQVRTTLGDRYAVINPGAAWPNKQWPPPRFGAIAAFLRSRFDLPSVVLWGPGEQRLAHAVVAASEGAATEAPATSIADLFAISRAAALLVSGDTGPLHIGAAVGAPIVGIYGPTDPARNGPWDPRDLCVSRFATCTCHHQRRCTRGTWCLEEITVDDVTAAVERRLAGAAAR